MIVTAWNNGAHSRNGNGYGLRVLQADRDSHFDRQWDKLILEIEGNDEPVEVRLDQEKLWGEAPYAIPCAELGRWMRRNGMAPWARGAAPVFELNQLEGNRFRVRKAGKQNRAQA